MVDFLVLLQLHFSPQLVSDYEGVQTALREQLHYVSQAGDGCGSDQSEPRLRDGGVRVPAPSGSRRSGGPQGSGPASRYLRQAGRWGPGPHPMVARLG